MPIYTKFVKVVKEAKVFYMLVVYTVDDGNEYEITRTFLNDTLKLIFKNELKEL